MAGDKLAQILGQPVVIDSRPGANSIVGAEAAARATADGYTFVQLNDAASTLNIALYPKLPYNTLKDFAPLTRAGSIAMRRGNGMDHEQEISALDDHLLGMSVFGNHRQHLRIERGEAGYIFGEQDCACFGLGRHLCFQKR